MNAENQNDMAKAGLTAGVLAYFMWGFFPVYFKLTDQTAALEILAHRIVWSVPFGALIILLRKQWGDIRRIFSKPATLLMLTLAACLIALNWALYIWAVQSNQIFQASLGYYINPIIFVLIGIIFFGEKLSKLQFAAVILAAIGVLILTFYGGKFPWIALTLAVSFTAYGVIRKKVEVGAMPGLFIETLVLLLPAIGLLLWLNAQNDLTFAHTTASMNMLLLMAGPITVLPLLAFAIAARRLRLSTLGFLQFIGPSIQFLMGIFYGEQLSPAYLLCFAFIWIAVGVFAWDAWRGKKKP